MQKQPVLETKFV